MFAFGCGGTLVSYITKKNTIFLLISTMHKGDDINGVTEKHEIIHRYNETKEGVDVVDKLFAQYNVARGTRRDSEKYICNLDVDEIQNLPPPGAVGRLLLWLEEKIEKPSILVESTEKFMCLEHINDIWAIPR
ncbi:hypothetical protein NQ318_007492 [Aromia moschata]|uniref:Glycosyltransferase family 92 protein n=1 Tax=Aromia moschata TaxID=1265417 RepID=A0AAV8YCL8_9CUCU|nr:hypothetical protein NQ318_007492 [Aromia moschata]